jgi:hypothetical protein
MNHEAHLMRTYGGKYCLLRQYSVNGDWASGRGIVYKVPVCSSVKGYFLSEAESSQAINNLTQTNT